MHQFVTHKVNSVFIANLLLSSERQFKIITKLVKYNLKNLFKVLKRQGAFLIFQNKNLV